jgi:CheY-like chemotaxis protein
MIPNTVTVLLIDDDKVDVMAAERSFRELKIANPIIGAANGIEALDLLRGDNGQTKISKPYVVLLDLNMPCMNGLEFLEELRADPALRSSLIFVMTTSAAEADRVGAYDKNVAGYILKSQFGQDFLDAIKMLNHYWRVIEFPT